MTATSPDPTPTPPAAAPSSGGIDWEQLGIPMIMLASDARMVRTNKAFRLLARSAGCDDIGTGTDWLSLLDAEARTQLFAALADRRGAAGPLGWVGNSGQPVRWLSATLRWHAQGTGCLCVLHDVTPVMLVEQTTRYRMDLLRERVHAMPLPLAYLDPKGRNVLYANQQFGRVFGLDVRQIEERLDRPFVDLVGKDLARVCRPAIEYVQNARTTIRIEHPQRVAQPPQPPAAVAPDTTQHAEALPPEDAHAVAVSAPVGAELDTPDESPDHRWIQISVAPHLDRVGVLMGLYVMLNDITRHHDQTQSLRDNQQRLHLLAEAAREGIVLLRDQQIAEANDVVCQWIGIPREALIGRPWSEFAGSITSPTGLRDCDGHPLPVEVLPTERVTARHPAELQTRVIRHLGDSQLARLRLDHLRYHDGLTGALNREGFHQRLSSALTTPIESGAWGVLQIGIDRIEALEEALGSPLTDALLVELTHRLREKLRSTDALASSGRGEFLVLTRLDSLSALGPLGRRLLQAIEKPVQLPGQSTPLEVGASIGCALCPAPGTPQESEQSIDVVLRQALRALDQVRQRGGSDIQEAGNAQSWGRVVDLQRESRGRSAMEQGHLALHFQPQLRCTDGAPVGAAATIMRRHADGHWLEWTLPGAADQLQAPLIRRISLWMLKTAAQAIRRWQPAGMPPWFSIVLPLSAPQLMSPEFAPQVGRILEDEHIPGHWIEFDLEPEAVIQTTEAALDPRIAALRQLGVRLSVEPLGDTAIAPARLRNLGVEKFRIGRSCVSGLPGDALSAVTARAVLDLARSRGLSVTADQVDTEAQHRFLVENGCDFVQGSVIGPRMNTSELAAWLAQTGLSPLAGEEDAAAAGGGIFNPS